MLYKSIPWRASRSNDPHYSDYLKRRKVITPSRTNTPAPMPAELADAAIAPSVPTDSAPESSQASSQSTDNLSAPRLSSTEPPIQAPPQQPPPQVTYQGYPPFDRQPPGLRRILYALLDPNPETRWSATDLLSDPWFKSIEFCRVVKPEEAVGGQSVGAAGGVIKYQIVGHRHTLPIGSLGRKRTHSARNDESGW